MPPTESPTAAPESTASNATTINVRCLLGHSHVDLAITCLSSMLRHSHESMSLALHDDGSLTDPAI